MGCEEGMKKRKGEGGKERGGKFEEGMKKRRKGEGGIVMGGGMKNRKKEE